VKLGFIQPGKPTQNAFCESLNGKLRNEYLNQFGTAHWRKFATRTISGGKITSTFGGTVLWATDCQ